MLPVVAADRPANVGKSTCSMRLTGTRDALVGISPASRAIGIRICAAHRRSVHRVDTGGLVENAARSRP